MWENLHSFIALPMFFSIKCKDAMAQGPQKPNSIQGRFWRGIKILQNFMKLGSKSPHIFLYMPWTSPLCSKEQTELFYQSSLPETHAFPALTFRIQAPIFIPGHGFELRVGGLLCVWIFTQGCANPPTQRSVSEASVAILVLLFMTQGWLSEPSCCADAARPSRCALVLSLSSPCCKRGSGKWAVCNSPLWIKRNKSGKHLQGGRGKLKMKAP